MPFNIDPVSGANQRRTLGMVTARWEWRTFSTLPFPTIVSTGSLEASMVRALHERDSSPSRELYFVSERAPHNVKIRESRLQVKRLISVNRTGLQQWRPILDTTFPIGGVRLRAFYTALGIVRTSLPGRYYDQLDLIESALLCDPTLRTVDLIKHRRPIQLRDCTGEHVTLTIAGRQWYSLAFEHDDPTRLRIILQRLGLTSLPNTSYPAFLTRATGSQCTTSSTLGTSAEAIPFHNNTEVP